MRGGITHRNGGTRQALTVTARARTAAAQSRCPAPPELPLRRGIQLAWGEGDFVLPVREKEDPWALTW
jgi:hypothetical protein